MNIKHFKIPSFEQAKNDRYTSDSIGDYLLITSVGQDITINLSVKAGYDLETIFEKISPSIKTIGEDETQTWYNKIIKEFNDFWERYITKSYLCEEKEYDNG